MPKRRYTYTVSVIEEVLAYDEGEALELIGERIMDLDESDFDYHLEEIDDAQN